MKLTTIAPYLLYEFNNESELIKAIEELSLKFTQRREQITDYLSDKRLASAYTAFYLTSNVPKLKTVLEWMPSSFVEKLKTSTLIDLGSGPGTFSLAFREMVGQPVKVVQIETSATMREQAKKLWDGLYPGENLFQFDDEKINVKGERFLIFGHSANEMEVSTALRYIKDTNPDHILFIEPGTKDFFPKMLKIRDELVAKGFNILFPCPTAESCPLLNSVNDWCHQFIHVRQDPELERLSQIAKKDRRLLPLTVQAFSRTFHRPELVTRITRVFPETKFSFEWEVCELNKIKHYQIMKRGLSKKVLNQLSEALAGSAVEVKIDKELEKCTRAKVLSLNNITLEP